MRRDRNLPALAAVGLCVVVWAAAQSPDTGSAATGTPSATSSTSTTTSTTTLDAPDDTASTTSSSSTTTDPSSGSSTSSSTSEPNVLIAVTLEGLSDGCFGLAGEGGDLNGCNPGNPVVTAELPPGEYVLSPLPELFNVWECDGGTLDEDTGRLTLSSNDSAVRCVWEVVGDFPPSPTTTTPAATTTTILETEPPTLPQTGGSGTSPPALPTTGPRAADIFIDEDLRGDELIAAIDERTFVATATVTIDGQDLEDLTSLVEGQAVPLAVVLEQVGDNAAVREELAESFPDQELVDFTRLNRVTITCDKPDGDTSTGCPDFDVTPAEQELEWPDRVFDFQFTPQRAGEIQIVVRVEGLVIELPSREVETARVAADSKFTVVVEVHPERELWNAFQASLVGPAPGLVVDVPDADPVRVAQTVEVSSTFTYPDGIRPEGPIGIELQLDRDEDGADASISPKQLRREGDSIHQSWLVTPNEHGALGLVFSYDASATVLGQELHLPFTPQIVKSLDVRPPPAVGESLPERVWNGSVTFANGLGALLATGMTAGGLYANHRRKLKKLVTAEPSAE